MRGGLVDGDGAVGFEFEGEDAAGLFDGLGDADPDRVGGVGGAFDDDDAIGFLRLLAEGGGEALGALGKLEGAAVEDAAGGGDGDLEVFTLVAFFGLFLSFRQDLGEAGFRLHGGTDEEENDQNERDVRAGAGRRIDEHFAAFEFHEEGEELTADFTDCSDWGKVCAGAVDSEALSDEVGASRIVRFQKSAKISEISG
jgi:hypothetical protein